MARESGETGRRAGFRIQCRKACGFDSRLSHFPRRPSVPRSGITGWNRPVRRRGERPPRGAAGSPVKDVGLHRGLRLADRWFCWRRILRRQIARHFCGGLFGRLLSKYSPIAVLGHEAVSAWRVRARLHGRLFWRRLRGGKCFRGRRLLRRLLQRSWDVCFGRRRGRNGLHVGSLNHSRSGPFPPLCAVKAKHIGPYRTVCRAEAVRTGLVSFVKPCVEPALRACSTAALNALRLPAVGAAGRYHRVVDVGAAASGSRGGPNRHGPRRHRRLDRWGSRRGIGCAAGNACEHQTAQHPDPQPRISLSTQRMRR